MAAVPSTPMPLSSANSLGGSAGLAADTRSLDALRGAAARDPRAATREAAKQFESLFMHELVKSMRAATPSSGLMDNEGTKLGTELLDQQLATKLTGLGGGLSEAIARQLERQMGLAPSKNASPQASAQSSSGKVALGATAARKTDSLAQIRPDLKPSLKPDLARSAGLERAATPQDFVAQHQDAAKQIEAATGIPVTFMLAQAAHETGCGRREIRQRDGSSANNLFGIKAGPDWKGPVAEVTTTEFIDGVAQKVKARFRAYASSAESFADYAKLMMQRPRYQKVMEKMAAQGPTAENFAQGLQRAGYATDPEYAAKLTRVINTTLRVQRAMA